MRKMTAMIALAVLASAATASAQANDNNTSDGAMPVPPPAVRATRRFGILAELGWNSLSGMGLNGTFHVIPNVSVDLGAGLSGEGWKTGLRARYNFLTGEFTPFVGAGMTAGWGTGGSTIEIITTGEPLVFTLGLMPYAQVVGGLDYTNSGGFTFLLTLGYAALVRNGVQIVSGGPPDNLQQAALNLAYGSGVSLGLALGYSF